MSRPPELPEPPAQPVVPEVVADAAGPGLAGLVERSARAGIDAAGLVAAEVTGLTLRLARAVLPPVVGGPALSGAADAVDDRIDRARAREARSRDEAAEAVRALIGRIAEIVIDQIDLPALVDRIPVDQIVDRVDVNAVVARLDIPAIADQAVDAIDVNAIVARLDIPAIADQAVDAIDLGAIVRDSTTGLVGETLDTVRDQSMGIDGLAARAVDWVLRRRTPRDLSFPAFADGPVARREPR